MKTRTHVKAGSGRPGNGGWIGNHNQGGMTAKTRVKAGKDTPPPRPPGGYINNHSQTAR